MPSLYIVVPVLNEAPNLDGLFEAVRTLQDQFGPTHRIIFILVDDGSTDGTADRAKQLSEGLDLVVLSHTKKMGPGYAFGTAFAYLAERLREDDWVVTMEGDNTSRHELLRQMFIRTEEGYDVILASPYMYGGGIVKTNPWRMFLSHVANAFIKEALGIHGILTMSSFYRLYRGQVILRLQDIYGDRIVDRNGFESVIEILIKMIWMNVSLSEVPMVLDTSRRKGSSKMKIPKTIYGYLTLWQDKRKWYGQLKLRSINFAKGVIEYGGTP